MAAPHVAGAIAAIKSKLPDATVSQIESALKTTGLAVPSINQSFTTPRIRVNQAISALTPQFSLTVNMEGEGLISSSPSGINCGSLCAYAFSSGTSVTLTAQPATGWRFVSWSGACQGSQSSCQLSIASNQEVVATFAQTYTLNTTLTGLGSLNTAPEGIHCPEVCSYSFDAQTSVTLTANASPGSRFVKWGGACQGDVGTCTLAMNAEQNVSAEFAQEYLLTTSVKGSGSVKSSPIGIACPGTCEFLFQDQTQVALRAEAVQGWRFLKWSGACEGAESECLVTLNANQTIAAEFIKLSSLSISVTGSGHVEGLGTNISCSDNCSENLPASSKLSLKAVAEPGFTFQSWSGACSGSNNICQLDMATDIQVSAHFLPLAPLSISVIGSGLVTSSPEGIFCPNICETSLMMNSQVTLTAKPVAGFAFSSWGGACSGITGTECIVTVDGQRAVSAIFKPLHTLTVNKGYGGTISSPQGQIDCGLSCSGTYPEGTAVSLLPTADPGYYFFGWYGPCSGKGDCLVKLDSDQSVSAFFNPIYPDPLTLLTVNIEGGGGVVSSLPSGIDCAPLCSQLFTRNTQVKLIAQPSEGYRFKRWIGGGCGGKRLQCKIRVLRKPIVVRAIFEK